MTGQSQGPSVNPHWDVSFALKQLRGLQSAGTLLVEEVDRHFTRVGDSRFTTHPESKGMATAAVMVVSYAAEFALKTLYAQTHPKEKPKDLGTHDLVALFDELDPAIQAQAQKCLETLPVLGNSDWLGDEPDLRLILEEDSGNFVEWRYVPEQTSNGVKAAPHALLNAVQALGHLCRDLAAGQSQPGHGQGGSTTPC